MQKLIITLISLITSFPILAQPNDLKVMGINLENYDYPFPVEYITLNLQHEEYKMAYMDVQPDKPNGRTVMLLHGKNFNGAYWWKTATALSNEGFRVVIPDQIGFGKSSKPRDLQYSFHLLARNTKAVLDTLGISKTTVLGHSMGGMLATRFILMYPEMIEKFVLLNPIGLEDYKLKVHYQPVEFWYRNELDKNYTSIKNYMKENYYGGNWKPEYDEWVEILAGWTQNISYPLIAWNAALTYDMIITQPVVYEFNQIKAPTLLLIGQRDKTALGKNLVSDEVKKTMGNYPQLGKETQNKIPNSKLVELDNVGHMPHIEAFDRFIEPLIRFLKQ